MPNVSFPARYVLARHISIMCYEIGICHIIIVLSLLRATCIIYVEKCKITRQIDQVITRLDTYVCGTVYTMYRWYYEVYERSYILFWKIYMEIMNT